MTKLSTDDFLLQNMIMEFGIRHVFAKIKFKYPELYQRIVEYNKHEKIPFAEQLYKYVHEMRHAPPCLQCGNHVNKFYGFNKGYAIFCSTRCASRYTMTKARRQATLKSKYGVESLVECRWNKK